MIATGILGSTYGLKGYLKFRSFSDSILHLKKLKKVNLKKDKKVIEVEIQDLEKKSDNFYIKFKGYDNPEDSKRLTGFEIILKREDAAILDKDEFYIADLIGYKVYFKDEELGEIISYLEGGNTTFYQVSFNDKTYLLPLDTHFIDDIEEDEKKVLIKSKDIAL